MKHKKFTKTERELLSQWLQEGVAKKACAKRLGRDIRTVQRELIRNQTRVSVGKHTWEMLYEPTYAHAVAKQRKQHAFMAKEPSKDKKIFTYVMEKLRDSWSPQQIAGRLKEVDHPASESSTRL